MLTEETVALWRSSLLHTPVGSVPVQWLGRTRSPESTVMKSDPLCRNVETFDRRKRVDVLLFTSEKLFVPRKPKPLESQVEMQEKRNNESERMDTYRSLKAVTR